MFLQEDLVGLDLSQVHGNPHIALARIIAHFAIEFGGDATGSTWAKPYMNAIIGGTFPFAVHIKYAKQARITALDHTWMHGVVLGSVSTYVHYNAGHASTNPAFIDSPSDAIEAIAMGKHRFEKGGGTRFQHFGNAQAGAYIPIILCKVAL